MTSSKWMNVLAVIGITSMLPACVGGGQVKPDQVNNGALTTVHVMSKQESQVALLLNKDRSLSVVGVESGKLLKPCKGSADTTKDERRAIATREEGLSACNPPDHGTVVFEDTYRVQVKKGSCCVTIRIGSTNQTYEYCDVNLCN